METRVLLVALLALASLHVIQGAGNDRVITPDDDDPPVSVFIPLPVSYNMTTQWLGVLRDSFIRIIGFERDSRIFDHRVAAKKIKELSQSYRDEMDDLVIRSGDRNLPCVQTNKEQVVQVLTTLDGALEGCAKSLEKAVVDYDNNLDKVLKKVASQDEATIYNPCLDSQPLTRKSLDRSQQCFRRHYRQSVESFYYPTGQEVFATVTETYLQLNIAEMQAHDCARAMIGVQDRMLKDRLKRLRECDVRSVALPGNAHASHSRSKRGFGKKLKKGWKKLKKGVKKLCNKIPCKVGYSIPLPGK